VSCASQEAATLEAEVALANESVYVWNRGEEQWGAAVVFVDERTEEMSKAFHGITPGGFVQFPLREFRKGTERVFEDDVLPGVVWVEVEGYAPREFRLGGSR
jgi:hypothetical protein